MKHPADKAQLVIDAALLLAFLLGLGAGVACV